MGAGTGHGHEVAARPLGDEAHDVGRGERHRPAGHLVGAGHPDPGAGGRLQRPRGRRFVGRLEECAVGHDSGDAGGHGPGPGAGRGEERPPAHPGRRRLALELAQPSAQPLDELRAGKIGGGPGRPQFDGGPEGLGLLVVDGPGGDRPVVRHRLRGTGTAATTERAHDSSSRTWAAIRSARCWRTLAFPTVMPMASALSRRDRRSRNRSSRMRRDRAGSTARMRWARLAA